MHHIFTPSVLLSVLFALPSSAQDGLPGPAPELQRLGHLIGTWEGEGEAVMAEGTPAMGWTSTTTERWVLGGHAIQEDMRVTFAQEGMPELVFHGYLTWDREASRYESFIVSNMGEVKSTEVRVTAAGAIVTVEQSLDETGEVATDRWVTRYDGDAMSFVGLRAVGAGDFFVHVSGTARRASATPAAVSITDAPSFLPAAPKEMASMARMVGEYAFRGTIVPAVGAPAIAISGTDHARSILGGTVLMITTKGDPTPEMQGFVYEGIHFIGWDPRNGCYQQIALNNMGEAHIIPAHWVDGSLVFTSAMTMGGVPVAQRMVLEVDESGALTRGTAHTLAGAAAPFESFAATYTKKAN